MNDTHTMKKKILKRPSVKPPPPAPKMQHGGARRGAGRPRLPREQKVSDALYIRCRPDVMVAVKEFLTRKNAELAKNGRPPVSFAKWARDILLVQIGREDLIDRDDD